MSTKKRIDKLFQEHFNEHEVLPPDIVWENIEAHLKEKQKKRVIPFWWKLSGLDADEFYLSVGGIVQTNLPPEDGSWQEAATFVAAGIKVVKFTYYHSEFINTDDSDGAFLDQFSFTPATNAPPIFWSSALSPDGFAARILLEINRSYTMQISTNLGDWTNHATFTSSDIFYDYFDPSATNTVGNRFYRVKSP